MINNEYFTMSTSQCRLHNVDCMKFMKSIPDKSFDIAIVDPEYGRGEHGGVNRSHMVKQKSGERQFVDGNKYKKKSWDTKPADDEYFNELIRVSKHQIIWECNYYSKNFGSGRVIWDKVNDGSDQSDAEIAYNSLTDRVDMFRFMWRGMMQGSSENGSKMQGNKALNEKRIHPTQKPVAVYKFLLKNYCQDDWTIFDSHLGSASIAIACHEMEHKKCNLIACEIDSEYFQDACKRVRDHVKQLRLI